MEEIEIASYEPSRQDSLDFFEELIVLEGSVCLAAMHENRIQGFAFGGPLEHFHHVRGVDNDQYLGLGATFYSADISVAPDSRCRGIATALKRAQLQSAVAQGYSFQTGRVRKTLADSMWRINRSFGAQIVEVVVNAYRDGFVPDEALYYRIELDAMIDRRDSAA